MKINHNNSLITSTALYESLSQADKYLLPDKSNFLYLILNPPYRSILDTLQLV
jgi:hypothetical protein